MKKIGIITIHNSPNYGACLQSFALYKYLELQGYPVEIIDLHRPYYDDYVPSSRFLPFDHYPKSIKQKLKEWVKGLLKKMLKTRLRLKKRKIIQNRRRNLMLSTLRYICRVLTLVLTIYMTIHLYMTCISPEVIRFGIQHNPFASSLTF